MGDIYSEEPTLIVDRSTLERYATCPLQARMTDLGYARHAGKAAVSGEEVHKAISATVQNYIDTQGGMTPPDIREDLERNLRSSRPDVQPDVIDGMRASAWAFASFLKDLHFTNILRFDGGECNRSGQLAADIEHLNVRVTAEVDFLHSTASPEVLDLEDWKTGRGRWGMDDVATSFQFQCYAWLVLENYPDVQQVRVRIWNTRFNERTPRIVFHRRDAGNYRSRIGTAAGEWLRNKDKPPELCIGYPSTEACRICDVCYRCPEADKDAKPIADSPEDFATLVGLKSEQLDALMKIVKAYVKKTGKPIHAPSGWRIGDDKPSERAKAVVLYKAKTDVEDDT